MKVTRVSHLCSRGEIIVECIMSDGSTWEYYSGKDIWVNLSEERGYALTESAAKYTKLFNEEVNHRQLLP